MKERDEHCVAINTHNRKLKKVTNGNAAETPWLLAQCVLVSLPPQFSTMFLWMERYRLDNKINQWATSKGTAGMAKTPKHTASTRPRCLGSLMDTQTQTHWGVRQLTGQWYGKHFGVHWYTPIAPGHKPSMAILCPVAPPTLTLHKK